jgi:hypothetical protein
MAQGPDEGMLSQTIDTGRSEQLVHVRYEDLLRAIGNYIDRYGLTDVLITQIPDGVLLKGNQIDRTARIPVERITAVLFTNDDVVALLDESLARRGQTDKLRMEWQEQHQRQ